MRLFALCALLAMTASPSLCERRNTKNCTSEEEFSCPNNFFCDIPQGSTVGVCKESQCTPTSHTCPATQPLCVDSHCSACQDNSQCISLVSPDTPLCDSSGRCVSCISNSDCAKDQFKPVCDATSKTCRACQLHSDCGVNGVCAKDNSFASLADPILPGTCVPSNRVIMVAQPTALQTAIGMVSAAQPYILLTGQLFGAISSKPFTVGAGGTPAGLPAGVPTFYIIGPSADVPPSKNIASSAARLENAGGQAIVISAGATTTLEGLAILNSDTGMECVSANTVTKVRLLRSFLGGNRIPIKSSSKCDLTIDASWIGRDPGGQFNNILNKRALDLDSTTLTIVNSVFWNNGLPQPAPTFAGISLKDTAGLNPLVRIVNSSFVDHVFNDAPSNVLAIDCPTAVNNNVAIVNSLFVNLAAPQSGISYVHSNCRQLGNLDGVASDDATLTSPTATSIVTNVDDNILVSAANGDLHLGNSAPTAVKNGGLISFKDAQMRSINIPTVDMEGRARGSGQVSIGAFEVTR